jgi:hypothetical protein
MPWGDANLDDEDDQNEEEDEDCEERQQVSDQGVEQQQQFMAQGQISEEHAKLLMMQMMGYVGTGGINGPSLGY